MTDPLAERLAAAERRLAQVDAEIAGLDQTANHEARIQAAEHEVAALADRLDVQLPRDADVVAGHARTKSSPEDSDPVNSYLQTTGQFADGLAKDRAYLVAQGIESVRWEDLLTVARMEKIDCELRRPVRAEAMDRGDLITVGICASLGVISVLLDDRIDGFVKNRICDLHKPGTPLGHSELGKQIRDWDRTSHNLAMDYSGTGIGGKGGVHRVRSAGHDLLRPFAAIEQIRSGHFTGHDWASNIRIPIDAASPREGWASYRQVQNNFGSNGAILLWLKHLAADFTTKQSLPLPGATFLHELPNHAIRSIGAEAYKGGFNLRRVLISGALPVAVVESGVRLSVILRTWSETGAVHLTAERKAKLENMLLASHGLVAAVSAGKVAVLWEAEGPAALRHLNLAVLATVFRYAIPVMIRYGRRDSEKLKFDRNERELIRGFDALLRTDRFMDTVQAFDDCEPLDVAM